MGGLGGWPNHFEDIGQGQQGSSPEDTWSNSSKGGIVPTTLNVEDWYVCPRVVLGDAGC